MLKLLFCFPAYTCPLCSFPLRWFSCSVSCMSMRMVAYREFSSQPVFRTEMVVGIWLSSLGLISFSSSVLSWFWIILSTLSFVGWLKGQINSSALSLFYVASLISSLLFLLGTLSGSFSHILIQLSILFKLGYAPFQFWVYKILPLLKFNSLVLFLGPFKIGFLMLFSQLNSSFTPFVLPSLILGILLLCVSTSLQIVLYASGSRMFFFLTLLGGPCSLIFIFIYNLSLLLVLCWHFGLSSLFFALLSLVGLPPLGMFWAKAILLSVLPFIFALLLLLVSSVTFWSYCRCGTLTLDVRHTSFTISRITILLPCTMVFAFIR